MSQPKTQLDFDRLSIIAALQRSNLTQSEWESIKAAWGRITKDHDEQRSTMERRDRILKLVQEALQQLRLDMKYLIFDLEATRRERDELRRTLGQ